MWGENGHETMLIKAIHRFPFTTGVSVHCDPVRTIQRVKLSTNSLPSGSGTRPSNHIFTCNWGHHNKGGASGVVPCAPHTHNGR